jgi:predicted permease
MHSLLQDLRYGVAAFARTPGFTTAAVLSLAIGVGVNASIYSVTSALLLHPLPYADADRLVILWNRSPGLGITEDWFSTAQFFDIKNNTPSFAQVEIAIGRNENVTSRGGEPERMGVVSISSGLLPLFGAQPLIGRLLRPEENQPGANRVAVLGYQAWMRRFGGDPAVVGRSLEFNGESLQIVGVLPSTFTLPREVLPTLGGVRDAEIVRPLPHPATAANVRTNEDYNIVARLRAGGSLEQARAELDSLTARLRRERPDLYPPNSGLTFDPVPLGEQVVGGVRLSLIVLMGSVGLVLIIACANVANLLLSRTLVREREIAVRATLGASRRRIIRQLLIESLILAAMGAAASMLFAYGSLIWIRKLGAAGVPRLDAIAINGEVLVFTLGVALASALLFGLAPAWRLSRVDLPQTLNAASRGSSGAGSAWASGGSLRRLFVIAELALSVVLLIGAGLLVRSFSRLQDVPPGFNPSNVLTLELAMAADRYNDANAVRESYRRMWERLRALPGVTAAGGVSSLPLSQMFAWGPISVEGRPLPAGQDFINADMRMVGGDYFRAMEIPLLKGRIFDERDTDANQQVMVIDDRMARDLWPGEDPIGKRVKLGGVSAKAPWITVVGVVGNIKQYTLDADSRIALYLADTQFPRRIMNIVVRSAAAPAILTAAVRDAVREFDPALPIYNVRTMDDRVGESLARRRFAMQLLSLFAVIALGLAAIGIYGVTAYLVSQGTRELGIRLALGATPRTILWMISRQTAVIAGAGVAIGVIGALLLTRFMHSLLFEIEPADPLTFMSIAVALGGIAMLAGYVPARRAARIDPVVSVRAE